MKANTIDPRSLASQQETRDVLDHLVETGRAIPLGRFADAPKHANHKRQLVEKAEMDRHRGM